MLQASYLFWLLPRAARSHWPISGSPSLTRARAAVVRDGSVVEVAAEDVVIDDLVALRPGDQIVVDGELEKLRRLGQFPNDAGEYDPAALYLAAAGVGTLGVIDGDTVDESNLQRQVLHGIDRVGQALGDRVRDPGVGEHARGAVGLLGGTEVRGAAFGDRRGGDRDDQCEKAELAKGKGAHGAILHHDRAETGIRPRIIRLRAERRK